MGRLAWVFILVLSLALCVSWSVTSPSELCPLLPGTSLTGIWGSLEGGIHIQGAVRIEIHQLANSNLLV